MIKEMVKDLPIGKLSPFNSLFAKASIFLFCIARPFTAAGKQSSRIDLLQLLTPSAFTFLRVIIP